MLFGSYATSPAIKIETENASDREFLTTYPATMRQIGVLWRRDVDRVEPRVILLRHDTELHGWDVRAIARTSEPGPGVGNSARPVRLFWDANLEKKSAVHSRETR